MEIHGKYVKKTHINKNKVKNCNSFTFFSLSIYFDQTTLPMSLLRKGVKNLNKNTEISKKAQRKIWRTSNTSHVLQTPVWLTAASKWQFQETLGSLCC